MDIQAAIEDLRTLVIRNELPHNEMAIFGIKCPYCGKSDRIRKLESPAELPESIDPVERSAYAELWRQLTSSDTTLGICRFCQNPLKLFQKNDRAAAFDEL